MRYISLFSGIEAASVGWRDLNFTPVAFSEIAPFQCEILKRHYPTVPNLGDITKIDWSEYAENVDIVVGGSPCQSFSVAAKNRTGLQGASGLMFEYIRAIRELRPKYFIWENVPGAFSSEEGAAFGQLITEMDELGYNMCWRVLDSQYFGSPQRRRRVFVVGHTGNRLIPATILLEQETLFKSTDESRRQEILTRRKTEKGLHSWGIIGSILNRCSPSVSCNSYGASYETAPTITASFMPHVVAYYDENTDESCVRHFTPHELERLFGFPDGYVTDTPFKGRPPKYTEVQEALGNSFCVPVIKWIGRRLKETDEMFYGKRS